MNRGQGGGRKPLSNYEYSGKYADFLLQNLQQRTVLFVFMGNISAASRMQ